MYACYCVYCIHEDNTCMYTCILCVRVCGVRLTHTVRIERYSRGRLLVYTLHCVIHLQCTILRNTYRMLRHRMGYVTYERG